MGINQSIIVFSIIIFFNNEAMSGLVNPIDSLKQLLINASEYEKIAINNKLVDYLIESEPNIALNYALMACDLSVKQNLLYEKLISINNIARCEYLTSEYEKVISYLDTVYQLVHGYEDIHAETAYILAKSYYQISQYSLSEVYAIESLDKFKKLIDQSGEVKSYVLLGLINFQLAEYTKALSKYHSALQSIEKFELLSFQGKVLNNIGYIHLKLNDPEKALKYFKNALDWHLKTGNLRSAGRSHHEIGSIYFENGQSDSSLFHQNRALELARQTDDNQYRALIHCRMGEKYTKNNQYLLAQMQFELALSIFGKFGIINGEVECLVQYGILKYNQGSYDTAISYLELGIKHGLERKQKSVVIGSYEALSETFIAKGDYKKAIMSLKTNQQLKSEVLAEANNRTITEMETKYDLERIKKEKALALYVAARQENKLLRQETIIYAFALGMIVLSFTSFLIFRNYKTKQKTAQLLIQKNEEINTQRIAKIIKEQEIKSIKANLKGQEVERKRIAKDLHDGLGGTLASIKLNLLKFNKTKDQTIINTTASKIDNACKEIRFISHNLLPPLIQNTSFIELLEFYVSEVKDTYDMDIDFEFYPHSELESLNMDMKADLYRIIQELMTNIIKHTAAKTITLQLINHHDHINIMIEDNGKGFNNKSTKKGIGLINIKSRIDLLGGQVNIDSKKGRGTIVNIDIPLNFSVTYET